MALSSYGMLAYPAPSQHGEQGSKWKWQAQLEATPPLRARPPPLAELCCGFRLIRDDERILLRLILMHSIMGQLSQRGNKLRPGARYTDHILSRYLLTASAWMLISCCAPRSQSQVGLLPVQSQTVEVV